MGIEEQVLWIPYRGEGTAHICCNCLQYNSHENGLLVIAQGKHYNGKGYEGYERDIIGDDH